jgi:hypothetical protein
VSPGQSAKDASEYGRAAVPQHGRQRWPAICRVLGQGRSDAAGTSSKFAVRGGPTVDLERRTVGSLLRPTEEARAKPGWFAAHYQARLGVDRRCHDRGNSWVAAIWVAACPILFY